MGVQGEKLGQENLSLTALIPMVKKGYDVELMRDESLKMFVFLLLHPAAQEKRRFLDVFKNGNADAALAASVFHYGEIKIGELKQYLYENGVVVRRTE